ncbi:DUF3783 domain-containing protein [Candidatus Woesearchaeota archaeon]|nr:DUF3783 domain-containing protein [Candidatus Woesearchaeota archaeon]
MAGFEELKRDDDKNELRDKVILLHGFSDQQVHAVMDQYHANASLPKAVFATITPFSRNKRVKDIVKELVQENKEAF